MVVGNRTDPYLAFNFLVEIKGLVVGGFAEVTGLQMEVEVQDYREGGENEFIHKFWGPTRYAANLVLKHGLTDANTLWGWCQEVAQGIINRRDISIILRDSVGEEKARWNFSRAYPVRWTGPELRASTTAVAMETLELVHQGFSKA